MHDYRPYVPDLPTRHCTHCGEPINGPSALLTSDPGIFHLQCVVNRLSVEDRQAMQSAPVFVEEERENRTMSPTRHARSIIAELLAAPNVEVLELDAGSDGCLTVAVAGECYSIQISPAPPPTASLYDRKVPRR
jgi:hypothetical protein